MISAFASTIGTRLRGLEPVTLGCAAMLIVIGLVLSLSASPVAAARMDFDSAFHFAWRQAAFALAGVIAFAVTASLSPTGVRRFAVALLGVALILLAASLALGAEVKGARRWLDFGPIAIQPSELLKPALIVTWAWALAIGMGRRDALGPLLALAIFAPGAALLWAQPDVGQTALLAVALVIMIAFSGASGWILAGLAALAAIGAAAAAAAFEHVRARLLAFITEPPEQVARALDAIASGGAFGRGPGEGIVKDHLPDAHSDFIFAVAAEEFGLVASIGLIALFATLAWRGLRLSARLVDPFQQLAAAGLYLIVGLQAAVHVAVNMSFAPAKGLTLPLVSYGGSSMVGAAITLGLAAALTRSRPGAYLYDKGTKA